jgi:hypothetical protein
MSTASDDKEKKLAKPIGEKSEQPPKPAPPQAPVLGVTTYDRVISVLLTGMMIFGLGTATFGAIWFSNQQWITHRPPPKIDVIEVIEDVEGGGTEDGVLGESLYAPGPESPDVSTAANQDDVTTDTPSVENQMTAVLSAVGAAMEISETLMAGTDIGSSSLPGGNPKGTGKHRNLGKGPGDGGGVKRAERWEISFDAGQTEQEYATQLDYFRVELGAIVERKMYMVANLSRPKPDVKVTPGGPDEKRLYFSWRSGGRRQIDLNLLTKSGVPLAGNVIVLQFYPFETEQLLARLEQEYLQKQKGHKDMRVVRKTKFSVVKKGGGYDFQITKQEYFGEKA